jgi:hypothetical protein
MQTKAMPNRRSDARRRVVPLTPAQETLSEYARSEDFLFVGICEVDDQMLTQNEAGIITISPAKGRKVSSSLGGLRFHRESDRPPAIFATTWWPVAVYWATMGGQHSDLSLDSGVCPHPDPQLAGGELITFVSDWRHWAHFRGLVLPVVSDGLFRPNEHAEWLLRRSSPALVPPNVDVIPVTGNDLVAVPIQTQPNKIMMAALGMTREDDEKLGRDTSSLPERGPHVDDDPNSACVIAGPQLAITPDRQFYTIGDVGKAWSIHLGGPEGQLRR